MFGNFFRFVGVSLGKFGGPSSQVSHVNPMSLTMRKPLGVVERGVVKGGVYF